MSSSFPKFDDISLWQSVSSSEDKRTVASVKNGESEITESEVKESEVKESEVKESEVQESEVKESEVKESEPERSGCGVLYFFFWAVSEADLFKTGCPIPL